MARFQVGPTGRPRVSNTRRVALTILALATTALATLSVSAALRDTTPPRLYFEAPLRLAEGHDAEVFVSADEPVTYVVNYAGTTHEAVDQDHTFTLSVAPGANTVTIVATDGAGNATEVSSSIEGVAAPLVTLRAPESLLSGEALGLSIDIDANGADIVGFELTVDGRAIKTIDRQEDTYAVVATPLTVDPLTLNVQAVLEDEFGRQSFAQREVNIEPLGFTIEQLGLSDSTLSLLTAENAELERLTLAEAYSKISSQPLWSRPFIMPISGRHSSGFADARRYAVGGPASFHNGLDLAALQGTPVAATNDGVVLVAAALPIKGGFVMIDHGFGLASLYLHQSEIYVEAGQPVKRGDIIGLVGSTGLSTGPHLHWEMRLAQQPTNPLSWTERLWPGDAVIQPTTQPTSQPTDQPTDESTNQP